MIEGLKVGLDAWVIQDGNYGEFRRGGSCAFALAFFSVGGELAPLHPDDGRGPGLTPVGGGLYDAVADVRFVAEDWHVIWAGAPAYREGPPPERWTLGGRVRGRIAVAIDPFSYFERLALREGAPALIFDWRIDDIERETTKGIDRSMRRFEDDAARTWMPVPHTKAWKHDEGMARYLLTCTQKGVEARCERRLRG